MYCKKITSIDNLINDKKIAESCLKDANEDNKKKQEYIEQLELKDLFQSSSCHSWHKLSHILQRAKIQIEMNTS